MASSSPARAERGAPPVPNTAFRRLRGLLSPAEFAARVRRAAREIGEQVSCDARYVGRVEAGEIRCPNYAYERVFHHMFPGLTLADLGFTAREQVRGRRGAPERSPAAEEAGGGVPGPATEGPHGRLAEAGNHPPGSRVKQGHNRYACPVARHPGDDT